MTLTGVQLSCRLRFLYPELSRLGASEFERTFELTILDERCLRVKLPKLRNFRRLVASPFVNLSKERLAGKVSAQVFGDTRKVPLPQLVGEGGGMWRD